MFGENDFLVQEREVVDCCGNKHINPFIVSCPAGKNPHCSHYHHSSTKTEILNFPETCKGCSHRSKSLVRYADGWMIVTILANPLQISRCRKHQQTEEFKMKYRRRSCIEATNSMLALVGALLNLRYASRSMLALWRRKTTHHAASIEIAIIWAAPRRLGKCG